MFFFFNRSDQEELVQSTQAPALLPMNTVSSSLLWTMMENVTAGMDTTLKNTSALWKSMLKLIWYAII